MDPGQAPSPRSDALAVEGGRPLRGSVRVSGSKNAALGAMAACLLVDQDCYLENVPDIGDVRFMAEVLRSLGAEVQWVGPGVLRVNAARVQSVPPPSHLVAHLRGSFLVMGALLGRFRWAACAPPGGDVIGQRPIDVHLQGFQALGARVWREGDKFVAEARQLRGAPIFLDYPSVLGTQNLMLAAVTAPGITTLINAACEPEVVALADMLNRMGACISGAGTHTIVVRGVGRLRGVVHRNIPDRIEAGTFAIAAAITGGRVEVQGLRTEHLWALVHKLRQAGVEVEEGEDRLLVTGTRPLRPLVIQALPYPGLATDLQAPMAALLTQAQGVSYVHERVFDNRLLYVAELRKMGAEVVTTGTTTAIITGPTPLMGAPVRALDVRAGAALILAGLAAQGCTLVADMHHVDRGYERLDEKLQALGAQVQRIDQGGG